MFKKHSFFYAVFCLKTDTKNQYYVGIEIYIFLKYLLYP